MRGHADGHEIHASPRACMTHALHACKCRVSRRRKGTGVGHHKEREGGHKPESALASPLLPKSGRPRFGMALPNMDARQLVEKRLDLFSKCSREAWSIVSAAEAMDAGAREIATWNVRPLSSWRGPELVMARSAACTSWRESGMPTHTCETRASMQTSIAQRTPENFFLRKATTATPGS
jgi:hypothetical protein